jgi:predicted nucleic acid-binding protein
MDAFFDGAFDLVLSLAIVAEVDAVLRRGHIRARPSFSLEDAHEVVIALLDAAEVARGAVRLDVVPTDVRDNHVIAAAIEGGARYVVTEDARDLLSLKVIRLSGFAPIQILNAASFLSGVLGR